MAMLASVSALMFGGVMDADLTSVVIRRRAHFATSNSVRRKRKRGGSVVRSNTLLTASSCMETREASKSWFAVRTRSRAEKVASIQLQAHGIEEFLPLYQMRRQWFDRVKVVSLPLFSGYIFCRCDRQSLVQVSSASAVANIVGFGHTHVTVPECEIQAIKQLVMSGLPASPCPFMREGTAVRIRRGPLQDVRGRLLKIKNQFRIVISVEMLSRSVSVEVAPEIVEAI
jgi:transcription antitermination factor NusG